MGRGQNNSSAAANATQASRNADAAATRFGGITFKDEEKEIWLADITKLGQSIGDFRSSFEIANGIEPSDSYELDHNDAVRFDELLGRVAYPYHPLGSDDLRELYARTRDKVLRVYERTEVSPLLTDITNRTFLAQTVSRQGFLTDREFELLNDSTLMRVASGAEKADLYSALSLARDFAVLAAASAANDREILRCYVNGNSHPAKTNFPRAAHSCFRSGLADIQKLAFPIRSVILLKNAGLDAATLDYPDGRQSLVIARRLEDSCSALSDESADYDFSAFRDPAIASTMIGYKGKKADARRIAKDLMLIDIPIAVPVEEPNSPGKFTVRHMKADDVDGYQRQLECLQRIVAPAEGDKNPGSGTKLDVLQSLTPDEARYFTYLREKVRRYKSEFESGDTRNATISIIGDEHGRMGLLEEPTSAVAKMLAANLVKTELVVAAGYFNSDDSDEEHAGARDELKEKLSSRRTWEYRSIYFTRN